MLCELFVLLLVCLGHGFGQTTILALLTEPTRRQFRREALSAARISHNQMFCGNVNSTQWLGTT